jgi:hypothetical protein
MGAELKIKELLLLLLLMLMLMIEREIFVCRRLLQLQLLI